LKKERTACNSLFRTELCSGTGSKDIPPCGEKTFALRVRVALMNILILIKKTKKSLTKLSYYVRVI
jgi:hypothetical protein